MGHYQDFSMADILERVEFKRVGGRESAVSSAGNSSFPTTPPPLAQPNKQDGRRTGSHRVQSAGATGSPQPIRRSQDLLREEEDEETKNNVPRIQCGDGCDPQGLKDNSQFCLQRIRQGLVFYKHLLDSDIFKGEPALLPDSPVEQLHTSLLDLSQLLQRFTTGRLNRCLA
ncbi:interleukin-23 subunit alpha isoform X3 [Mastomys coucha]|uniref:interleukin-23 subunit alpha isoform X3 n=1 Tax=Mastomys coucha TaxID=35658 RepID=UPI0012619D3B|nr:interleukin-23 subunit alpha isoform X3 [Mastomys coucha]